MVLALVGAQLVAVAAARPPAVADPCPGGSTAPVWPGAPRACIHVDETPPGIDVERPVSTSELGARDGASAEAVLAAQESGTPTPTSYAAGSTVACDGDGTSGYRVQAMYVVAADRPNRFADLRASIQQWAAGVDDVVNRSAALTGGVRRVRYVTSDNGDGTCSADVLNVTVPTGANASFSSTISAVSALGHTSPARKYLMWVDASVLCGVGQVYPYSTDGQSNPNNGSYPQMSRIDTGCWGLAGSVEAHELVHTLGAVLPGSPHRTTNGHCYDESDRMCYSDGSGVAMQQVCASDNEVLLDCRADDYFSTAPTAGSWLDTHWNAADSRFLIGGGDGSGGGSPGTVTSLGVTLAVNNPGLAGLATQVTATPVVPDGRTATVRWTSARTDCTFSDPTLLQSEVTCSAANLTATTVTVTATDSTGATARATGALTFSSQQRTSATSLLVDGRSGSAYSGCTGSLVALTGTVLDSASSAPVKGVRVEFLKRAGTTTTVIGSAVTDAAGVARSALQTVVSGVAYTARSVASTAWTAASSTETAVTSTAPCATSLTSVPATTSIGYAAPLRITGRLLKTSGGVTDGAAGQVVSVRLLPTGATTTVTLGSASTAYDGTWAVTVTPKTSGALYAELPTKPALLGARSTSSSLAVASWTPAVTVTSASPTALAYGGAMTVKGSVTKTAWGVTSAAAGVKVTVTQQATGQAETTVGTALTLTDGSFSVLAKPTLSSVVRVRVTGVVGYGTAVAAQTTAVTVTPRLALSAVSSALGGAPITWTARITPLRSVSLSLQRQSGTSWDSVATIPVVNGVGSVVTAAPSTLGTWSYRLSFAGDSLSAATTSPVRALKTT
ncbi:MAG: hypothetical protein Q8R60_18550 [Mycobacteriales bacterium]|nr:hypothetical protein [Mycobacteriales bacterium]